MSRVPLLAGNWKMHKTVREALALVDGLLAGLGESRDREVLVCPPFTALSAVQQRIHGSTMRLGCQDVHWEEKGAFTGEVSAAMAKDVGCQYALVGHSERRAMFGDTDEVCRKKVRGVLDWGMTPILCVGESLAEREAGATQDKVSAQVRNALAGSVAAVDDGIVIAYEPIWAIGTGKTDSPTEANRTIGLIRGVLGEIFGEGSAQRIRILYGGSVNPSNVDGFMAQPEIDGALVGGASLDPGSFLRIVHYHQQEAAV
jgi:triosephosphate isomerase